MVISIVSHGHGAMVNRLLHEIAQLGATTVARVVLTINTSEPESFQTPSAGWPFELQVLRNAQPKGFGANHNQALRGAREAFVCVLNPDVQLYSSYPQDLFAALMVAAGQPGVGCAYPVQRDFEGQVQDSERELPTPWALFQRRLMGCGESRVDWVNAACLVLPTPVWQACGGFDEAYYMYCEDVDLCLRLRLMGLALVRAPVQVVHRGQRASQRRWVHLRWHVQSLLRLWRSPVFRQARQFLRAQDKGTGTIDAS